MTEAMSEELLAGMVVAALTGDPDDLVDEGFAAGAVLTDGPDDPLVQGAADILAHFMAFGGRREVAAVHDVFVCGTRGALAATVWFRADAHAYAQHGRVLLTVDEAGKITHWDGVWVEAESNLSPWGGD